jgi:hypothetical protein
VSEMNPMTEERIARNDSIFRDANEQINAKAQQHDTDEEQAVPSSANALTSTASQSFRSRWLSTRASERTRASS